MPPWLDEAQLALEVVSVDVFARTSPEHKLCLVTALQANGHRHHSGPVCGQLPAAAAGFLGTEAVPLTD